MRYFVIFFILIGFSGAVFGEESTDFQIPEPEQDISVSKKCGPGTTYNDGICVVNETEENSVKSVSDRWGGPMWIHDIKSPLKQFQLGITIDEIQCKENLVLVQKHDGSPACVSIFTKIDLIIRGWGEDDSVLLGCTPTRHEKCYPSDPTEYRKALYDYYFDDTSLPSSDSFDFPLMHTINACTSQSVCFGEFENGTKIRISCDYPIHGCGVKSFDGYKQEDEN